MAPQRVKRPTEQQLKVRYFLGSSVNNDGVRREISEALKFTGQGATDPAYGVERRQQVDESQQVSNHDLSRTQSQAFGVDHPDFEHALSESLTAPNPF